MRALHVIAGLRTGDGGPAYSVPRLCRALAAAGVNTELMTVAEQAPVVSVGPNFREQRFVWDYARLPLLRDLRASSAMAGALRSEAASADVVHDHGIWLMPNVYAGREAARAAKPLVVAPRGMLNSAALAFSRVKKSAFWHLLQKGAIARVACFHATSEQEYREIRAFGLMQPVAIVPNGIDLGNGSANREVQRLGPRTVLYLGRIHPIKGLDVLLRAWGRIESRHPEWRLHIAGSSERDYGAALRALAAEVGVVRVSIEDAVYGEEKSRLFAEASLFVLPSMTENFGVTVAESLAAGVPVIATKGTPWSGLVREDCGWWIDFGAEPLEASLSAAMALPPERLAAMGKKGSAWVAQEFSWEQIAQNILGLYAWLSGMADRPAFVRCD